MGSALICSGCWQPGPSYRLGEHVLVWGLYGLGAERSGACAGCGRRVVRNDDPRLVHHTCSNACSVKASKTATNGSPAVTRCECCGAEMAGRADRRFCSSACRQRDYRARRKTVS